MKRADGILCRAEVDGGFSADRRVDQGEHRVGNCDPAHTASASEAARPAMSSPRAADADDDGLPIDRSFDGDTKDAFHEASVCVVHRRGDDLERSPYALRHGPSLDAMSGSTTSSVTALHGSARGGQAFLQVRLGRIGPMSTP